MRNNDETRPSWEEGVVFHFIEVIVKWEGRLTRAHLQEAFSIGRDKASRLLTRYQRQVPDNIVLCPQQKGYLLSEAFKGEFSQGDVNEYLRLVRDRFESNPVMGLLPESNLAIEQVKLPSRQVNAEILQSLIQAIRDKQRTDVVYRSMNNPKGTGRIIAPHSLVFAEGRWHVRAYCEEKKRFLDFVIQRFVEVTDHLGPILVGTGLEDDGEWDQLVTLKLKPNPALSKAQRQLIADDYKLSVKGTLSVKVRAPLVKYLANSLRLTNLEAAMQSPQAHQLVLANHDEVQFYLIN